jgi:hypothetical protein
MAEPPTIGESLRSGVKSLLDASFEEVAQKAADRAVAQMRSNLPATDGQGMTIHQALGALTSICEVLIERDHAVTTRLDEIENCVRGLVQRAAARRHG